MRDIYTSGLNKVLFWSWAQPLDQSLLSGRWISWPSRPRIHTYPHECLYPQASRACLWDCQVRRSFPGMRSNPYPATPPQQKPTCFFFEFSLLPQTLKALPFPETQNRFHHGALTSKGILFFHYLTVCNQGKSHSNFKSGLRIQLSLSLKNRWKREGGRERISNPHQLNCSKSLSLNFFHKKLHREAFPVSSRRVLICFRARYAWFLKFFLKTYLGLSALCQLRILGPEPALPVAFVSLGNTLLKNWGNST